jgi:hypothetical protein
MEIEAVEGPVCRMRSNADTCFFRPSSPQRQRHRGGGDILLSSNAETRHGGARPITFNNNIITPALGYLDDKCSTSRRMSICGVFLSRFVLVSRVAVVDEHQSTKPQALHRSSCQTLACTIGLSHLIDNHHGSVMPSLIDIIGRVAAEEVPEPGPA